MKLKTVQPEISDAVEKCFELTEVSIADLSAPSEAFVKAVGLLKNFSLVNAFTMDEFTRQVHESFADEKIEGG